MTTHTGITLIYGVGIALMLLIAYATFVAPVRTTFATADQRAWAMLVAGLGIGASLTLVTLAAIQLVKIRLYLRNRRKGHIPSHPSDGA